MKKLVASTFFVCSVLLSFAIVGKAEAAQAVSLSNGVTTTLNARQGSNLFYTLSVPSGASSLTISTVGGTGDDDIYVKLGSQPTSSKTTCSWNSWDYTWSGATPATSESTTITNPAPGTYYITIAACSGISNIQLTATYSVSTPTVSLSATALNFGSVNLGATSQPQTITLTNSGTLALTFTSLFAFTGDFTGSGNCYTTVPLAPGASCVLNTTFTPTSSGTRTGTITVATNDPSGTKTVALSGTGVVPVATLSLSSSALSFGSVNVGATSPAQTITLTNTGTASLTITSLFAFTGDFTGSGNCYTSSPLAPGASCVLNVTFAPTSSGTRTGTITMTSNDPAGTKTVALSGTGVVPVPALALSSSALNFGNVNVGTISAPQTITFTNSGTASLSFTSLFSFTGDFTGNGTCYTSVPLVPGATCVLNVTFAPTVNGARTGTITIQTNDPSGTKTVTLTGSGMTPAPALTLSSSALNFGSVNLGATSQPQTITLTNSGTLALTFTSLFAFTGDFTGSGNCYTTVPLAPGASCTLSVTFAPTVSGTRTGTIAVATNDPAGTKTISLTGSGAVAIPGTTTLTNGVASAPVTAAVGTNTRYTITVPAGVSSLTISTTGGTGDDDIYVKLGSQPTSSNTICSWNSGDYTWKGATAATNESTTITNPAAGTYYITIAACSAFSNVQTKAAYTTTVTTPPTTPSVITLTNGTASAPVTAAIGTNTYYSITVPTGASSLTISTTGGTGDDDFYVSLGTMPQPVSGGYTWKGATAATNESLTLTNPAAGTYNIVLNAYTAISNIQTTGTYVQPVTTTPTPALSLSATALNFGTVTVGATSPAQTVTLTNTGTANLIITSAFAFTGDFAGTGTCLAGIPLAPGMSCLLNVTFAPTLSGTRTGSVAIATNDPAGTKTVTLTGNGSSTTPTPTPTSCNASSYTVTPAVATQSAWDSVLASRYGSSVPDLSGGAETFAWQGHYWVRAFVSMAKTFGDTKYLDKAVTMIDYWFAHQDGGAQSQGWGASINPAQMMLDTGMISQAIALFSYEVWSDPRFVAYRPKADSYISQIEPILRTYDPQWVTNVAAYPGSPSFYIYATCGGLCSTNSFVMYNQGATMTKSLLLIDRVKRLKGLTPNAGYLDKADKAAAYFKTFARLNGNAYVWDYGGARGSGTEDVSHGHIDFSLLTWANKFGIGGITSTDLTRLVGTMKVELTAQGANKVSFLVDGTQTPPSVWDTAAMGYDWIELVDTDPTLLNQVTSVYNAQMVGQTGSRFMLGWAEILRKRSCIAL
jgi:hypothetical protein